MTNYYKWSVFVLRVTTGWLMFYAGITKIMNPEWSAAGYLTNAKSFPGLFEFFASPTLLPFTNFLNEWGLTLLGVSLILGIGIRWSAILGFVLMMLYYFPILDFPYPNEHSYIIDEHIIYAVVFLVLGALDAGTVMGLEKWFRSKYGKK